MSTVTVVLIGIFLLGGGIISMMIADDIGSDRTFIVSACIALIGSVLFFGGLIIASRQQQHVDRVTNRLVKAACFPFVVTNRHDGGGTVVFDCRNDGRLRSIKVVKP